MPIRYILLLFTLFFFTHFNNLQGNNTFDSLVAERHLDASTIENLIQENKRSNLELKIIEITGVIKEAKSKNNTKKAEDLTLLLGELYMQTGQYETSINLLEELLSQMLELLPWIMTR